MSGETQGAERVRAIEYARPDLALQARRARHATLLAVLSLAFGVGAFLMPSLHGGANHLALAVWLTCGVASAAYVLQARAYHLAKIRWAVAVLAASVVVGSVGVVSFFTAGSGHGDTHNQIRCASNMRQIGLGLLMYAAEHDGRFPNTLQELFQTDRYVERHAFVCPASQDTAPAGPTTQAVVADLVRPGHLSYWYLAKGLTSSCEPETVFLVEVQARHADGASNVLYADGHVDSVARPQAQAILAQLRAGVNPPQTTPQQ